MGNRRSIQINKEVLLSADDVQQYFKVSNATLKLFNSSLKPVRFKNKTVYTLSSILNLLSELINKEAKK